MNYRSGGITFISITMFLAALGIKAQRRVAIHDGIERELTIAVILILFLVLLVTTFGF